MGIYRHHQTKKLEFLKTFHRCNLVLYIQKNNYFPFCFSTEVKAKNLFMSVGFFGSKTHSYIQFLSQIDSLFL